MICPLLGWGKSRLLSLFFSLLALLAPLPSAAAELHVFLIGDTLNSTVGDSTSADLDKMRRFAESVSSYTDLELKLNTFSGKKMAAEAVLRALEQHAPSADDVVLFYFSGHGYRATSKGENPWPTLFFSREKVGLDLGLIAEMLIEKRPRLLFAIADCCNNIVPDRRAPPLVARGMIPISAHTIEKNFKSLFLKERGFYIIASSKPGQYSWGGSTGGVFTLAFLQNVKRETLRPNPSWQRILEHSKEAVVKITKRDTNQEQTPHYLYLPPPL